jgi:tRNA(fMet)-specific endonuclease VapC
VAGLVVVDTDLLVDFLRGKGAGVVLVRTLLVEHRLRLTAVTGFELRVGTDFVTRRDEILRLFRSRTLPLDLASALRGGEVAAALRALGQGIGFADSLQAGICLRHDLPLATRNRKHFDRIPGLPLADIDTA